MHPKREDYPLSEQVQSGRYFFLTRTPSQKKRKNVIFGGFEKCRSDYRIQRNGFRSYTLEIVHAGKGLFESKGIQSPLQIGSAYIYGPNIPHLIQSDPDQPLEKYFIDFEGPDIPSFLQEHQLPLGTPFQLNYHHQAITHCEKLLQYGQQDSSLKNQKCAALLELILLLTAENISPDSTHISRSYSTYLRCRQHLEEHFLKISSVSQLANQCNIQKQYLCRLFARYATQTAHQYLTHLKMNRAADLLLAKDTLVKEVAYELGYEDPYHFSRVFKKSHGSSPREFITTHERTPTLSQTSLASSLYSKER